MKPLSLIHNKSQFGDQPVNPLTEQSLHEDDQLSQQNLMASESNIRTICYFNETGQSYSSFQPKQFVPQGQEIREEINYIQPSDLTKYSEHLYIDSQKNSNCQSRILFKNQTKNSELILKDKKAQIFLQTSRANSNSKTNTIHEVTQRLVKDKSNKQLQYEMNLKLSEKLELKDCTFKPSLTPKSIGIANQNSQKLSSPRYMSPRNTSEFYNQKQKQTIAYLEDKFQNESVFKPTISQKSKNLVENKENVFQRLNQKPKIKIRDKESQEKEQSLNSNAGYVRPMTPTYPYEVSEKLYQDAFKEKKIKIQFCQDPQSLKQENKKTERLQTEHFVKEFYFALTNARSWTLDYFKDKKPKFDINFNFECDLCMMTLDETVLVLDYLGFLPLTSYKIDDPNNKVILLFKQLVCPIDFELILSRNLLIFLLALQGIAVNLKLVPLYNNIYKVAFPEFYQNQLFKFENGNIVIKETQHLQKQFNDYYLSYLSYNRRVSSNSEKSQTQEEQNIKSQQFKERTELLASQYRNRIKCTLDTKEELEINDYKLLYNMKKQYIAQELIQKQLDQCTFKPVINKNSKSKPGTLMQKPPNQINNPKPVHLISFEKQQDQCTFTPDISRSQSSHQNHQQMKQSEQERKTLERMIKGRVEKRAEKIAQSIGRALSPNQRAHIQQQALQEELSERDKQQIPHSLSSTMYRTPVNAQSPKYQNFPQPILYVDVNIDQENMSRIVINEGDDAEQLAQEFAIKHKLNQAMKEKLVQLLEDQLSLVQT